MVSKSQHQGGGEENIPLEKMYEHLGRSLIERTAQYIFLQESLFHAPSSTL